MIAPPAPSPPSSPTPLLVGRERELAALREALDAAFAGRGSLVLIGGEAGIGKTVLAETICAEAAQRGALILVGRCYDLAETPPHGPWVDALAGAPRDDGLPPPPDLTGGGGIVGQAAIFAAVRDFFAALVARQPVVLLLDDLHWADPASLDLLRFFARGSGNSSLLLLAAYRVDELTRRHPLYPLLPALVREAGAARVEVRRLGSADTGALVRVRYGLPARDEARLITHIHERAEGNPFYAGELLRALEEQGLLSCTATGWALGDLAGVRVPPLLRQVIDARVDRLGEETRALLAIAAVIGQAVPLDLWATVGEAPEEALLAPVERAIEAGLLAESDGGATVRFAHALIREALHEGLAPVRRRLVHRRAGAALAASPAADPDAVAYHFRQAGDERAAEWLIRAGDRAQRAYALISAAERFEAALALLEQRGTASRERGWLLLRLARVRRMAAPREGLRYLDEASAIAAALQDATLAAYIQTNRGMLLNNSGAKREGMAELERGVAALDALSSLDRARLRELQEFIGDPRDEHPYRGTLALLLGFNGYHTRALFLAERAIADTRDEAAVGGVGASFIADAYFALAWASAVLGYPAAAWIAFARAREHYQAVGHYYNAGSTHVGELIAAISYRADEPAALRQLAEQAGAVVSRSRGARDDLPMGSCNLPVLILAGDWAEARDLAQAARPSGVEISIRALAVLAQAQGDAELGWSLVRDWLPAGPESGPDEARFTNFLAAMQLQRLAAALALDASVLPLAESWLVANDRWLALSDAVLEWAEGQLAWASYHRVAGDSARAYTHTERALTHASEPRQPLVLLAAHRTLGELDTASGRYIEARVNLDAALALAEACAAPYERALTLLALAELHVAEHQRDTAIAALAEARTILVPLDALPALTRADALAARLAAPAATTPVALFGLTVREVDVLRLLAEGLTDLQIAERLIVSRNTINAHTRAIYGKLSVNTRAAATRFALDHGLAAPALPFGLTPREAEVLRLVAQGLPDAEVAERLFLSRRTVHAHLRTIYGKLGVATRSAATRLAIEHSLA